ncbi:MAG: hypothetical protein JRJ76_05640, partial [Deltaproteobacteria bacterium]|nr:hypothetical protein [Deltaproteobacteria bacterium]
YWYGNDSKKVVYNSEVDTAALDEKFISISPIQFDMIDYNILEDLNEWGIDKWGERQEVRGER